MTNPLENNKLLKLTELQAQKKRLKHFFNINKCRKTIIINSSLHVTVANLMFYITLFKVTLLDVFNYLKSNLNLKLLPLNSGN